LRTLHRFTRPTCRSRPSLKSPLVSFSLVLQHCVGGYPDIYSSEDITPELTYRQPVSSHITDDWLPCKQRCCLYAYNCACIPFNTPRQCDTVSFPRH